MACRRRASACSGAVARCSGGGPAQAKNPAAANVATAVTRSCRGVFRTVLPTGGTACSQAVCYVTGAPGQSRCFFDASRILDAASETAASGCPGLVRTEGDSALPRKRRSGARPDHHTAARARHPVPVRSARPARTGATHKHSLWVLWPRGSPTTSVARRLRVARRPRRYTVAASGTASRTSPISLSVLTPSASPSKFRISRCLSAGTAARRTSLKATL